MFRLLTDLSQTVIANSTTGLSVHSNLPSPPVTERCIPVRRRRVRKKAAFGANDQLRSTWF